MQQHIGEKRRKQNQKPKRSLQSEKKNAQMRLLPLLDLVGHMVDAKGLDDLLQANQLISKGLDGHLESLVLSLDHPGLLQITLRLSLLAESAASSTGAIAGSSGASDFCAGAVGVGGKIGGGFGGGAAGGRGRERSVTIVVVVDVVVVIVVMGVDVRRGGCGGEMRGGV